MEEKKISYWWSALIGLLMPVLQLGIFYFRFGRVNQDSSPLDYFMFFLAGTVGGLILIYFLNRQTSKTAWWVVMVVFVLASPVAMIFMIGGGLLGPLGVLIFPQIIWALFMWIGTLITKFVTRD